MSDPQGETIRALLARPRTLAVVGMSRDPAKAAHRVPLAMARRGFSVIPVNPSADEIAGLRCRPTLDAVEETVDAVLVFRPPAEAPDVARAAAARRAARGDAGVLWLQLGIASAEARRIAHGAGIAFVEDRCMDIEAALLEDPDS